MDGVTTQGQQMSEATPTTPVIVSAEATTQRGLDEYGIPASLLFAVASGIKKLGVDVWARATANEQWLPLSDSEKFFAWVRRSKVPRLQLRVTGSDATACCQELCSLVDVGDSKCVIRAGFHEVTAGQVSNTKAVVLLQGNALRTMGWLRERSKTFWRFQPQDGGTTNCQWKGWADLLVTDFEGSACFAYCLSRSVADQLNRLFLMDDDALTRMGMRVGADAEVIITNKFGIHSRPAAIFVKEATRYGSTITVEKEGEVVNGKSIMGVMMLVFAVGERMVIRAEGDDAHEAVKALAALVEKGFGEGSDW